MDINKKAENLINIALLKDQSEDVIESMKVLAKILYEYYEQLTNLGFNTDQATMFTLAYQANFFSQK